MQFVIIGLDGTDSEALNRRMAARPAHLALGDKLLASGNMWYAAALWNDDGKMKGSMMLMDFPSEKGTKRLACRGALRHRRCVALD